jgi:hypothetical protein
MSGELEQESLAVPVNEMETDILIKQTTLRGIPIKIQVTDKPILETEAPVALVISYDTAEQLFLALANALHVPRKQQSAEMKELHGN